MSKKILTLLFAVIILAMPGFSATVSYYSSELATISVTSSTAPIGPVNAVQIAPNSAWTPGPSMWISNDVNTGGNNPTVVRPANSTMTFTQSLNKVDLTQYTITSVRILVASDDTSWGYIGTEQVFSPTNITQANHCIVGDPTCVRTFDTGTITTAAVLTALNTAGVQFTNVQQQLFGGPTGTNWRIDVEYGARGIEAIPEPGTYALMGAGLVGLAILRRRRA